MLTQQNCAAWIEALAATPGVKQVCLVHVDGHRLATDAVYPANSKVPTAPPVSAGSAVTLEGEWPIMPTDRVIQVINRLRSAKHLPPLHCELSPIKGVWERGKWSGTLNAHDFEDQPT